MEQVSVIVTIIFMTPSLEKKKMAFSDQLETDYA